MGQAQSLFLHAMAYTGVMEKDRSCHAIPTVHGAILSPMLVCCRQDKRSPALSWRLAGAFQGKLEWFGRCLGARRGTQRRKVDQEKREGKAKQRTWDGGGNMCNISAGLMLVVSSNSW